MTRYRLPALCLLLAACVASAADPAIRLPVAPVLPQPMPAPVEPGGVLRLTPDMLAVIDADVPVRVLAVPRGLVKVTKEAGPLRVRGQFVDGVPGKAETRTYSGKSVWVIEAVGTGRVDVLVVPEGPAKPDDADVQTLSLDVSGGTGPIPPPKPVDPKVEPVAVKTFRVLFVYESGDTLTAAQNGVLYAKSLADYLDARCTKDGPTAGWRRRDKDASADAESPGIKTLWAAVKPHLTATPCLVIEADGKADILPLPATAADALATLKKYAGDK